jgi:tetratricopeptide (TPR) repeat protein
LFLAVCFQLLSPIHATLQDAESHFQLAQAYTLDGNLDAAIESYKRTLLHDPSSNLVRVRLSMVYIQKGLLGPALDTTLEALKRDPKHLDARALRAALHLLAGEQQEALTLYEHLLPETESETARNKEIFLQIIQILSDLGKEEEALKRLDAYTSSPETSGTLLLTKARLQLRAKKIPEAIQTFTTALKDPQTETQASLSLALIHETEGRIEEAKKIYTRIFESKQDPLAADRLAYQYIQEKNYPQAIKVLSTLSERYPQDAQLWMKIGLLWIEMKDLKTAYSAFRKSYELNSDNERVRFYIGSLLLEEKQEEDGLPFLASIPEQSPLFTDATIHQVLTLKKLKRFKEAKLRLEKILNQPQPQAVWYFLSASLSEEQQEMQAAINVLEEGLKHYPLDDRLLIFYALLLDQVKRQDEALVSMLRVLKIDPERVEAMNYVGYIWSERGIRLEEAKVLLDKARQLSPDNGFILDSWGWNCFKRGAFQEALKALDQAVRLIPAEPAVHEHHGATLEALDLPQQAATAYEKALKLAKDAEDKARLKKKLEVLKALQHSS